MLTFKQFQEACCAACDDTVGDYNEKTVKALDEKSKKKTDDKEDLRQLDTNLKYLSKVRRKGNDKKYKKSDRKSNKVTDY